MEVLLIKKQPRHFLSFILVVSVFCGIIFACSNQEEDFQKGLTAERQGDYTTALKYYAASAEKGNTLAQKNLALMYWQGHGVEKNDKLAFEWMMKSAEGGNPWALSLAADFLINGQGVQKNVDEALKWIRKAAVQGNAGAQEILKYYELHHEIPPWATW